MNAAVLNFPVIAIKTGFAQRFDTWEQLTTTTASAIRRGRFTGLMIVDSDGQAVMIDRAQDVRGIGRFRGWTVFLNRRVRVELVQERPSFGISASELKTRLAAAFREDPVWQGSTELPAMQRRLAAAVDIDEVIKSL